MTSTVLRAHVGGLIFADHICGADPPIVALHGWGRDRHDLTQVLSGRRIVAFDLPGFGASPAPTEAWGADDYAVAVAKALEEIRRDQPFVVVGHSRGGSIACCLAAARPDLVAGLVVLASPLLAPVHKKQSFVYRTMRAASQRGLIPKATFDRLRELRGSADYRASTGIMRSILVRLVNESYESQLASILCPVGFCWGQNDAEVAVNTARTAAELVSNCVVVETLAGVGHDVHREAPESVQRVISQVVSACSQ